MATQLNNAACLLLISCAVAQAGVSSKTFFSAAPPYSTGSPEHISFYRNDRMLVCPDSFDASFQAVTFGGASTNANDLARYFFPWDKKSLVIAEGPNTVPDPSTTPANQFVGGADAFKNNSYDLLARNFNIETTEHTFQSHINIRPSQSYVGCAINYRQNLSHCLHRGFWFDITLPVVRIKNAMHLEELVTQSGTSLPGTMPNVSEAFLNPNWNFGKIAPCAMERTGIADVEMRIGYDVMRSYVCSVGGFLGFIVPTGNRPNAEFVFEPIVGRNHHWGIEWGGAASFCFWEDKEDDAHIYLNVESNNYYLFPSRERRSLDLKDKPWSRYITLFDAANAKHLTPGINVLTQDLKISPHGTYQLNTAITFDWLNNFMFEVGAHAFMRNGESGRLMCQWEEGAAIAGAAAANPALEKPTADSMSNATMRSWNYELIAPDADLGNLHVNTADNTLVFMPIKEHDLDIQSALHPFYCAHTIYGTFGYQDLDADYPWFAALGGGYQFGTDNAIMQRWTLWGKVSLSV